MRRVLFGLLTLGACAANADALANEAVAAEDSSPPPLRKSLDPQAEIFPDAAGAPQSIWSADVKKTAATASPLDVSPIFGRISFREERSIEPILANPAAPDANAALSAPPLWTKELNNILGRDSGGNVSIGYQSIVEAIKLQGWFGVGAAQAYIWKTELENKRQGGGAGYRAGWQLDFAPTPQTMFYAKSFYSPVFQTSLVEIKPGYAVLDGFSFVMLPDGKLYIGPFAVLNSNWQDKISKAGVHLTFGQIGAFTLTLAGGYARERFAGAAGAFGLIESSVRF